MPAPVISIRQAVAQAYRDFKAVADAMPPLTMLAMTLMIMFDAVIELQLPLGRGDTMALPLAVFVIGLAQALILTPYVIAVHRFMSLGEVAARYVFAPRDLRNQLYFLWWAAFAALAGAPVFLLALPELVETSDQLTGVLTLVLVYYAGLVITALRLTTLFPAIAVDAPGARWRNAIADSRGHVWRIFLIYLLAFLPAMLVGALAQWIGGISPSMVFVLVLSVFEGIVGFVIITLYAVITSRLYQALGDKVKRAE